MSHADTPASPPRVPDGYTYAWTAARDWAVAQPAAWTLDEVASSCLHWLLGATKAAAPAEIAGYVAGIRDGLAARAEATR